MRFYLDEGARLRGVIEGLLPGDWSWEGKRVLDFGCGSARVLRHFANEAQSGEFWGCDVDEASVEWDQANLSPPFRFFENGLAPPLSLADDSLDLVWAMSVFTHIADLWSDWLVEMHRVLAPGGVLIASFLGEGMWEALVREPYREDEVGMSVLHHWEGPDCWVFHSEWWLREHWGRAFEVVHIAEPIHNFSWALLRKRDVELTADDIARPSDDRREFCAIQHNLRRAQKEIEDSQQRFDAELHDRNERLLEPAIPLRI